MNKSIISARLEKYNKKVVFASASEALASDVVGGQTLIACPPRVVNFGIDTLVLTLDLAIPDEFLTSLETQKKNIQNGLAESALFKFGESNLFSFSLQRTGVKYYQYILRSGDITLMFSTRKGGSKIPSSSLHIGSITCQNNLDSFLDSLSLWFDHYHIKKVEEKVSRIDLCVDHTKDISTTNLNKGDYRICRASTATVRETDYRFNSFSIGSGDVVLRCYDKILEMKQKQQDYKQEFFQEKWGNVDTLTRVEYQLRRGFIKEVFQEQSDYKHIKEHLQEIWKYLTTEWFRLTESPVDRKNKNQSQSKTSEFWYQIQRGFGSLRKVIASKRNKKQRHINVPALTKQALGCLFSACSGMGLMIDEEKQQSDMFDFVHDSLYGFFTNKMKDLGFRKEYYNKMASAIVSF